MREFFLFTNFKAQEGYFLPSWLEILFLRQLVICRLEGSSWIENFILARLGHFRFNESIWLENFVFAEKRLLHKYHFDTKIRK